MPSSVGSWACFLSDLWLIKELDSSAKFEH